MLNKILNQLDQLSKDELRTLNSMVVATLKANNKISSIRKARSLYVGQEVEIDHPKYKGQKFIIKKVNRTKCVINDGGHTMFTCPMSMIIA